MADTISRSWLLNDLDSWLKQIGIYTGDDCCEKAKQELAGEMIYAFKSVVERAPDSDDRPHARWIRYRPDGFAFPAWTCSACKKVYLLEPPERGKYKFCPECGAVMDLGEVN